MLLSADVKNSDKPAIGKKGEGPGEIKRIEQAPIFLAGDKIVVQDTDRRYYFSRDGKYLYRGFIKVSADFRITSGPVIKNNDLYMALEDEDGEITLNKYELILPD